MMNKAGVLALVFVGVLSLTLVGDDGGTTLFGFGGSSVGLVLADLAGVNAFLLDNGFATLCDAVVVTGGGGRGGTLGGPSIGGLGWAGETSSQGEDRTAVLSVGFGGLELGAALGGDARSFLTLGIVIGGGGSMLRLLGADPGNTCGSYGIAGLIPEPTSQETYSGFAAVMPFFNMHVQPLRWLGFELQVGYLLPLIEMQWGDAELDADLSLPRMEGFVVSLSLTWGGIGRLRMEPFWVEEVVEQTVPLVGPCVDITNALGAIHVVSSGGDAIQTRSESVVEIHALKRARSQEALDALIIRVEPSRCGLLISSDTPESSLWSIDYSLSVPSGTQLSAKQGAGSIVLNGYVGTADVEFGVGRIVIDGYVGTELALSGGVGDVTLVDVDANEVDVNLGTGRVDVSVLPDRVDRLSIDVGVGDVELGLFLGVEAGQVGGLERDVDITIGSGSRVLTIELGIGVVHVHP